MARGAERSDLLIREGDAECAEAAAAAAKRLQLLVEGIPVHRVHSGSGSAEHSAPHGQGRAVDPYQGQRGQLEAVGIAFVQLCQLSAQFELDGGHRGFSLDGILGASSPGAFAIAAEQGAVVVLQPLAIAPQLALEAIDEHAALVFDADEGGANWNEYGDLDGDGHVGHSGLGILLADWGCPTGP